MTKRKHNTKRSSDKRVARPPLDLAKVNPHGRLDVLAANVIERFAQSRAPELLPILEKKRSVIHAALNSQLGPHAIGIDVPALIEKLTPYAPLMWAVVQNAMNNSLLTECAKSLADIKERAAQAGTKA
jgi:hypothetical protein